MSEEDHPFIDRVTRSLRGELSPSEQLELDQLIESDPAKRKESEKLIVTYDLLSLCAATEAEPREIPVEVLEGVRSSAKKNIKPHKSTRSFWLTLALWAGGIVTAIIVGMTLLSIWRQPNEKVLIEYAVQLNTGFGVARSPGAHLTEKMNKIIFPTVQFQGATLEEAIEYLRVKSREFDAFTDEEGVKGVPIILRQGDVPSNVAISLDLKDVPMSEALRYIAELAQMKFRVEAHAVLVVPLDEDTTVMYTRSYRVPPDFVGAGAGSGKQVLEGLGIPFPEGSSASYNPVTSSLVVRNTEPNLDLVEAVVESITYPLDTHVLRDVLDGSEVKELENKLALQEWENNWSASNTRPVFKILLQERGTWEQSWTKFNKYAIGRIKVMGRWQGRDFQKTFTVTSDDSWSKVVKDAQAYINETIQMQNK